ncbi:MAG: ubiquinone biosynthesis protein COQ7 [Christensenellales bacterium]
MNIFSNQSSMNNFDVLQNARQDLCGEIQAVIEYDNHIKSTTDPMAKQTWMNIRNEELTHVGELLGLLNYLDPEQKQYVQLGLTEFEKRLS